MLLRRAVVAAATLTTLVLASPASGLFKERSVSGNLDGDADIEQVKAERVPDPVDPADNDLAQTAVDVLDTCAGTPIQTRITSVQEALVTLRLVDADTHAGKDVFTDLRSGASGRVGEIRLVSWRPQVGGPVCAAPRILFKYSSRHPTHRPPGTVAMADFVASVRDFTPRFRGKELRLSEGWVTRTDALCCPTFEKTSFYRYVPARDRFIRYHTDLKRNKQH